MQRGDTPVSFWWLGQKNSAWICVCRARTGSGNLILNTIFSHGHVPAVCREAQMRKEDLREEDRFLRIPNIGM
jgi:hypothetical protein